jgi:hypothetical protein
MYTGTLINDLTAVVERAESNARQRVDTAEVEHWHVLATYQLGPAEQNLLGVA